MYIAQVVLLNCVGRSATLLSRNCCLVRNQCCLCWVGGSEDDLWREEGVSDWTDMAEYNKAGLCSV